MACIKLSTTVIQSTSEMPFIESVYVWWFQVRKLELLLCDFYTFYKGISEVLCITVVDNFIHAMYVYINKDRVLDITK